MNKTAQNKKGFTPLLIVLLAVGVIAAVLVYMYTNSKSKAPESGLGDLPTADQRTNPAPMGDSSVSVSKIDPGTQVNIDSVRLEKDGYIVVQEGNASGARKTLGKSDLLKAGSHDGLSVTTSQLTDGMAVYVALQDSSGMAVKDANGNAVEVFINVGKLMGHQVKPDPNNDYY